MLSRRDFVKLLPAGTIGELLSRQGSAAPVVPTHRSGEPSPGPRTSVPLIYSTDLFHPPDDPDDHVDLVTLFALPEFDIRALILDLGQLQRAKPGSIPVQQMMALTGKEVPFAAGLAHPLSYPEDKGLSQFKVYQAGVELILRALEESERPVNVITVGSARDVSAAFNRAPHLFREKVARWYVNVGNSGGGHLQWNSHLDPQAYLRLMTSDLPICWCPSFGSRATFETFAAGGLQTQRHQVYWKFLQRDIYEALPKPLQNFFLYALGHKHPSNEDPITYLQREPEPELRDCVWGQTRSMWSTASLYHAAGRKLYRKQDQWAILAQPLPEYQLASVYDFVPATVSIDRDLRTTLQLDHPTGKFQVFRILDLADYESAMQTSLRKLLAEMSLANLAKKGP